jgi:hypothetical protein
MRDRVAELGSEVKIRKPSWLSKTAHVFHPDGVQTILPVPGSSTTIEVDKPGSWVIYWKQDDQVVVDTQKIDVSDVSEPEAIEEDEAPLVLPSKPITSR